MLLLSFRTCANLRQARTFAFCTRRTLSGSAAYRKCHSPASEILYSLTSFGTCQKLQEAVTKLCSCLYVRPQHLRQCGRDDPSAVFRENNVPREVTPCRDKRSSTASRNTLNRSASRPAKAFS